MVCFLSASDMPICPYVVVRQIGHAHSLTNKRVIRLVLVSDCRYELYCRFVCGTFLIHSSLLSADICIIYMAGVNAPNGIFLFNSKRMCQNYDDGDVIIDSNQLIKKSLSISIALHRFDFISFFDARPFAYHFRLGEPI